MSDTQLEPETSPSPGAAPSRSRPSPPVAEQPLPHDRADGERPADLADSIASEPAITPEREPAPRTARRTPRRGSRTPSAPAPGFPWEQSPLAKFPTSTLLAEIDARRARARKLAAEAQRVSSALATLEAQLAAMGIAVDAGLAPRPRRQAPAARHSRPRNSVSLADALALAIEVRALVSPAEAARLVQSNGYQSSAKNFGMVVANAMSKDRRFSRIGRGRYERVAG